jgi:hypothetical protein
LVDANGRPVDTYDEDVMVHIGKAHPAFVAAVVTELLARRAQAAELQAAHDAGVAEGKASERGLEMFVVRSLAHEVEGGDDKTAEQLIEMLLAERDAARADVATLRQIISDAAREVGAQVSPGCSLDFMAMLPRETALAIRQARRRG